MPSNYQTLANGKGSVLAAIGVMLAPLAGGWLYAPALEGIMGAAYINASRTAIKTALAGLLGALFVEAKRAALDPDNWEGLEVQKKIKEIIFETTGLELETLDAEGGKRAIGKYMADKINLQYSTNFASFYPPTNIVEDMKAQLLAEIMTAVDASIA